MELVRPCRDQEMYAAKRQMKRQIKEFDLRRHHVVKAPHQFKDF